MKKTTAIKLLSLCFAGFLALGLVACKGGKDSSSTPVEKQTLKSPENLYISLNLTDTYQTEYLLTWDKVSKARGYKVDVNGETFSTSDTSLPLTGIKPDVDTTFEVRAIGNGIEYRSSEPTTLVTAVRPVSNKLKFDLIEGGYEIGRSDTYFLNEHLVLPDTYKGEPIVSIADYAFGLDTPTGGATNTCRYVRYPAYVKHIGLYAFSRLYFNDTEFTLPKHVEIVEEGAFWMTNISKLTLNDVVKEIGAIAFNGTYISGELFIPKTVTKLGDDAFSATNVSKVTFEDGSTLEEIGIGLFFSCNNLTEIPDGLPYISAAMFQQCRGLTNITIPSSVKSIGEFAFNECPNLLPVHIPNNVEKIHGSSFALSSKATLSFDEDHPVYKMVDGVVFTQDGKQLIMYNPVLEQDSYTVPDGVEVLDNYAFYLSKNLKSISLPNTLKTIGAYCFAQTGITEISLPDSVTSFGAQAFTSAKLTKIKLSAGLTEIPDYAFQNSSFTHIDIPDGVTKIGDCAFLFNEVIKSVIFPKSVVEIAPQNLRLFGAMIYNLNTGLKVFYEGSADDWHKACTTGKISSATLIDYGPDPFGGDPTIKEIPIYFYSEDRPNDPDGLYWHYDKNGNPVVWEKG